HGRKLSFSDIASLGPRNVTVTELIMFGVLGQNASPVVRFSVYVVPPKRVGIVPRLAHNVPILVTTANEVNAPHHISHPHSLQKVVQRVPGVGVFPSTAKSSASKNPLNKFSESQSAQWSVSDIMPP